VQCGSASVIRRGVLAAMAAACGLAAGCTADLDGTDDATGLDPPGSLTEPVEPGQFTALPEPCGAVDEETLRALLPGGDAEVYEGVPAATYDTGRRVGCEWHSPAETTTHQLVVDFERVISYDPEISDDDQAALEFDELAADAGVSPGGSGSGTETDETETGTGSGSEAGIGSTATDGPEEPEDDALEGGYAEEPTSPEGALASRPLDDIGHAAYIDDQLTSANASASREVEVVFRNANVIVTVNYTVSTSVAGDEPESATLQEGAQTVAQQLAGGFDD
jgi:hypothetical protein